MAAMREYRVDLRVVSSGGSTPKIYRVKARSLDGAERAALAHVDFPASSEFRVLGKPLLQKSAKKPTRKSGSSKKRSRR